MTTAMKLTDTQKTVILAATQRADGNIEPLPATLRGGARAKVIEGLLTRGYVKRQGKLYHLTDAGYAAVGRSRPQPAPKPKAPAKHATGAQETPAAAKPHRTRENTKQAHVIAMLKRPEGATIQQICRDHRLAAAHGARHLRRRVQEETRTRHHLHKARGRRTRLPDRRVIRAAHGHHRFRATQDALPGQHPDAFLRCTTVRRSSTASRFGRSYATPSCPTNGST